LWEYIHNTRSAGLLEQEAVIIFSEIAHTLKYIHSNNISHHDIKPQNILFDDVTGAVKIIDFGYAIGAHGPLVDHAYGTPVYASPEVLIHNKHDPLAADMWSLGIVFFELLTGTTPWEGVGNISDLIFAVLHSEIKYPKHISLMTALLLKQLLERNPEKRITITEVIAALQTQQQKNSEAG